MITGLLKVLFLAVGQGLLYLGYGKDGMAAREKLKKKSDGLAIGFGVVAFIWLFFGLLFYLMDPKGGDAYISLTICLVCPAVYILWVLFARRSVGKLIEEADKLERE